MKKYVYLAVLAASVLLTICLFRETRRLQGRVQQLEEERKRMAHSKFVSSWVDITDEEREGMVNIYRGIAQAYTNRDIMAMRIAMLKLPAVSDHLPWQLSPLIEKPLSVGDAEADGANPRMAVGIHGQTAMTTGATRAARSAGSRTNSTPGSRRRSTSTPTRAGRLCSCTSRSSGRPGNGLSSRSPSCSNGLKGSDPSVYALLYMLDFGAADVVDYAAS